MLGSPLGFTRKMLAIFAASASARRQRANEQVLDTLERYTWLPQTELVFVHAGRAQLVTASERGCPHRGRTAHMATHEHS